MGDRVLIQCVNNEGGFSPVLYLHWGGYVAPEIIKKAAPNMRKGDISYAFARLVAAACNHLSDDALGVGVWAVDGKLVSGDSHGDNGIFLINVDDGSIDHIEGYSGDMEPVELYRG